MPIFDHTFRPYEGAARRHFRWWIIAAQEFRVLFAQRGFVALVLLATLPILLRMLMIVAYDMAKYMSKDIAMVVAQANFLTVNERTFFDFLRIQSPFVFLITVMAGSGLICSDFRNNLTLVYYAKPLTWKDYAFGKIGALFILGMSLTAVPGLLLLLLHNLLVPSVATFTNSVWMIAPIIEFSAVVTLACSLGVLALSALFLSQRFVGVAAFMILLANVAFGESLSQALAIPNCRIIVIPLAINRVGEALFKQTQLVFPASAFYAFLVPLVIMVVGFWIVCSKARRAEFAR